MICFSDEKQNFCICLASAISGLSYVFWHRFLLYAVVVTCRASGTVSFFCNLLSNYERHNTTQLYRYRLELQKHKRQLQHKKQQKQSPDAVCGGTTQPDCHEVKDDGTLGGSNMPACSVSAECDEDGSFEFPFHAPHDVTYTGARHAVSRDSLTTDIEGNFDATLSAPKLPVTVDLSFVTGASQAVEPMY